MAPTEGEHAAEEATSPGSSREWLWEHIGRISGMVVGLIAFAFVVFLAFLGWPPAYGLIVLVVVGVAMIVIGGRIRGT